MNIWIGDRSNSRPNLAALSVACNLHKRQVALKPAIGLSGDVQLRGGFPQALSMERAFIDQEQHRSITTAAATLSPTPMIAATISSVRRKKTAAPGAWGAIIPSTVATGCAGRANQVPTARAHPKPNIFRVRKGQETLPHRTNEGASNNPGRRNGERLAP